MKNWLDAWHVNPAVNRDYDFIDGLRGIAILMVLVCHHLYVNPHAGPATQFAGALFEAAGGGVILFFALSGFLIAWPFWKRKFSARPDTVPPKYAQRRFWKIYPPLALSIVLLTPFYVWLNHDSSYVGIAAKWLAGLPFIVPVDGRLNPVMWTLVVEVQFYIALPLVFLAVKRISASVCLWLIPLLFLLVPVVFRFCTGLRPAFHPEIDPHFPAALDSFCIGIWVAGLDTRGALQRKNANLAWIGIVLWPLALVFTAWLYVQPERQNFAREEIRLWMEKIASGCLLFLVANPKGILPSLLSAPVLRWCGIVSYEWYLFHQPIVLGARTYLGSAGGNVARYAMIVGGSFVTSAVIAAVVYRFFSLPILKFGREEK